MILSGDERGIREAMPVPDAAALEHSLALT